MYIIMDLDDTLLKKDKSLSKFTLDTLDSLKKDGHIIVFNTARSLDATLDVIDIVKPHYSILNGGALIVKGKEKIYEDVVSNDLVNKIIKELLENNVEEFSIQCDEGLFSNLESYPLKNPKATYFDYTNEFKYVASKILLCDPSGEIANRLSLKYDLKITHYVNGPWYRLSTCNKQDGNVALFKLLKDNSPKSICFGDDIGDLEMLKEATVGVALSNSVEKVLNEIKIVTKYSSDEDGVAIFLDEYFKKNKTSI
ncbi:MAG: HAD-IIB family hydrolase [bacterium]